MKRFLFSALSLVALSSCDINIIEPRYDYRDQVVGTYDVEEHSDTYNDYVYYSLNITKRGSTQDAIYLNNFYGAGISVRAYVDYNDITIPYQVVDSYEIEGSGHFTGSTISLNYRVKDLYTDDPADYCDTWGDRY